METAPDKSSSQLDLIELLRAFDSTETSSTTCISDPDFVNEVQVADFFNGLLEDRQGGLFAFGSILLSRGIKPKHLVKLVRSTSDKNIHRHAVHLNTTTGYLTYIVKQKGNNQTTDIGLIEVPLPPAIIEILSKADNNRPFKKIHGRFDRRARKFRKAKGGVTPTSRRLAKTFHLLVAPHMTDRLSANVVSGNISSEFRAQAFYYQHSNRELYDDYQPAYNHMVETVVSEPTAGKPLRRYLKTFEFDGEVPDHLIGSKRITDDEALEKFFTDIYDAADDAHKPIRYKHGLDQVRAFARFMNLESAHLFQMQRYIYAYRTMADRTEVYTTPVMHIAIIVDKDSKDFREMRVVPRNTIEMEQQRVNQHDLSILLALAEQTGIHIHFDDNLHAHNYSVHLTLECDAKTNRHTLTVQRLTQKRFNALMDEEGIHNPSVDNAGRHDFATRSRDVIPEIHRDQQLNHNRATHNGYARHSSASISTRDLESNAAKINDLFPFKLLKRSQPISRASLSNDIWQTLQKNPLVLPHVMRGTLDSDKPARFSVLPDDPREFSYYPDVVDAYHFLWQKGFALQKTPNALRLIGLVLSCCLELGQGGDYLLESLMRMQWQDLAPHLRLRIPFTRSEKDTPYFTFPITKSGMNLLMGFYLDHQPLPGKYIFLPDVTKFGDRKKAIKVALHNQWHELKKSFKTAHPDKELPALPVALRLGRVHATHTVGIEPFITTSHTDWPPPTTHAARFHDPLLLEELVDPIRYTQTIDNPRTSFRMRAAPTRLQFNYKKGETLYKKMRKILRSLTRKLNEIADEKNDGKWTRLKYAGVAKTVHDHIDTLLEEADMLCPSGNSALHLALEWTRYRFQEGQHDSHLAASTVTEYLGHVFRSRLFAKPEAADLSRLDAGTLADYLYEWTIKKKFKGKNTASQIQNRFKEVMTFGVSHGYLPNLAGIPFLKGKSEILGTRRADIPSPHHIDTLIKAHAASNDREAMEQAAMLILAHYCGLRESEIRNLTLDDIVAVPGHCFIYIRQGKSYRARRGVPLHLVGHPDHVDILKALYDNRRAELAPFGDDLKGTFLLGPPGNRRGYRRWEITSVVIEMLKYHLGPDADLHLLRHSFGSWLLVRLTALRYPHIVDELTYRGHWMFKPEHQQSLTDFFSLYRGELPSHEANSLYRIARIIGHASVNTLLTYYVQTMNVIQKEVVMRASAVFDKQIVNFATSKILFPGLRSYGDFRKLSGQHFKTMSDVFDYILPRFIQLRSRQAKRRKKSGTSAKQHR